MNPKLSLLRRSLWGSNHTRPGGERAVIFINTTDGKLGWVFTLVEAHPSQIGSYWRVEVEESARSQKQKEIIPPFAMLIISGA